MEPCYQLIAMLSEKLQSYLDVNKCLSDVENALKVEPHSVGAQKMSKYVIY